MLQRIEKQLASLRKLKSEIECVLNITAEQKVNRLFDDKKLQGRALKDLRVAAIMDRFTLECFGPECILTELTPEGWLIEMQQAKPDLLFIESAWEGKDGLWHGKINHCSVELCELTDYCHTHNIPVVFWNKEDPVYTEVFMNTARQADAVFTTDMECVQKYKTELGHDQVYHLHFAAQPIMHNPIEKYERKDKFCFAGAYYHRYEQRCKIFDAFSKHFLETRGLDIFDRNYPSPRPEHKFPDIYNPYILGKLDPSEIDLAYKGYIFGINMNSVTQSQTMFARRVFELMASNTIVIGNYSRGVKNYFGDLTICTDDEKTLKNTLEKYCCDPDKRDKYRLLGLRKVLTEHLCEDRLDEIINKIYGVSLKPKLPLITVVARCKTLEEIIRIRKIFELQAYRYKQLVIVTNEKTDVQKSEQIYSFEQFGQMKLAEVCKDGYLAYFSPSDWYGKNYLLDLALTTRYRNFDVVGKAAYFSNQNGQIQVYDDQFAYRPVKILLAKRSIVKTNCIISLTGEQLQEDTDWQYPEMQAIDRFNYCQDWKEDYCLMAEDLEIADQGIERKILEQAPNQIMALLPSMNTIKIEAKEIASIRIPSDIPVQLQQEGKRVKMTSNLSEGSYHYIYLERKIYLKDLLEDGHITILFRGQGTLSLVCGCVFYDASGKKLDVRYPKLGRREKVLVPPNADYLILLYRPRESGTALLESIELGPSVQSSNYGDCYLTRSNVLILTNHYPAPDDLYRNMFVHKRVMAYKKDGFIVDVMRMNPYAKNEFREFEGINIIEGHGEDLTGLLSSGQINTVCVHFLDWDMWDILKNYLGSIKLLIWSHGADIQPWWRRKFVYTTPQQIENAKKISEIKVSLWNEVFQKANILDNQIRFIFVSEYARSIVEEDYHQNLKKNSFIIHNLIDTDQFIYCSKSPELRKNIISIRPYSSTIYGNDIMVQVILILSKKDWFNELSFTIVGQGELLKEITKPLNQFSNVKIEEKFLRQDEIVAYYQKNGIVLIPTRGDTQGVSRDEAMSCGLVPITNAVAAIPEFVDDRCGVLAPAEDAQAMADGIEKLYHNPELFLQMSQSAAQRVRRQTSKEYTIYKELELIFKKNKKRISIFGSCVTRDVFRIFPQNDIEIDSYIARQNIASAVSSPLPIDKNSINLSSSFQKEVVWLDFNKKTFDVLSADKSDWLIIDLIDERLSLLNIEGTYITKSNEAVNGGVIPDNSKDCPLRFDGRDYYRGDICIRKSINLFCEKIKNIYPQNRIIIHKAKCVDHYKDKNGKLCKYDDEKISLANTINSLLDYMYDILFHNLSGCHIVDCMEGAYGSETHLWGLSIIHYEDIYYKKILEKLKDILK